MLNKFINTYCIAFFKQISFQNKMFSMLNKVNLLLKIISSIAITLLLKVHHKSTKPKNYNTTLFADRTNSRLPTRNACKGERTKLRRAREGDLKDTSPWQRANTHTDTPTQFNDSCHPHWAGIRRIRPYPQSFSY